MGKKKTKNKLLSPDYYFALENLRTGGGMRINKNGSMSLPEKLTPLMNHANTRSRRSGFFYASISTAI